MAEGNNILKTTIDISTLILLALGLFFAKDQAEKLNENIRQSNYNLGAQTAISIATATLEVRKLFVAEPELTDYFFDGKDIKEADPLYKKARAMAALMLSYFESTMALATYEDKRIKEHGGEGPSSISRLDGWGSYVRSVFERSPLLCSRFQAHEKAYGRSLQVIAIPACKLGH